jgi:uncharacterized protein with HEPN domain
VSDRDRFYVRHVLECIERIERYTASGRETFFSDTPIHDGVIRNLQILAESTSRISTESKSRWPDVAWRVLAGFRNVVAHDYIGLDLEEIRDIVRLNIPPLKQQMESIAEDFDSETNAWLRLLPASTSCLAAH